jgi:thiol-disulfide isomerase/thioredoxin
MKANILHVVPQPQLRRLAIVITALCVFSGLSIAQAPSSWVGIELEEGRHGGVGVHGVVPGSPAAATDLQSGDEVLAIDDEPVHAPLELRRSVSARPIGKRMRLKVRAASGAERVVVVAPAARPSDLEVAKQRLLNRPAPAFSLPRVDAAKAAPLETLAAHHGHPLLIDFWATWCGPCVRALPQLAKLRQRWAARGLRVIGISTEEPALLQEAIVRYGIGHPILADTQESTFRAFGIAALPTLVLIDGEGKVRAIEIGGDLVSLENDLAALVGRPE